MPKDTDSLGTFPLVVNVAAFVVVVWGVATAKSFFIPLCLAALLASAMAPAVRLFRRYRFPEWLSVLLASLIVLVPLASSLYFAVMEVQLVVADWPKIAASLKSVATSFKDSQWAHTFNLQSYLEPHALAERIGELAGSGAMLFLGGLLTVLSAGTTFVLIVLFSVIMLASRERLRKAADLAFATYGDGRSASLLDQVTNLIESFLLARFGITIVTALAAGLILALFKVPYALLLALFYGLMTWVPVVGIAAGILPILAVAVALGEGSASLLLMVILLVVVWIVQDHVLQPKWLGGQLKLNFLATYLAIFAGEHLWGPWGMFLFVPLLGVARIVISANRSLKPLAYAMSEEAEPPRD